MTFELMISRIDALKASFSSSNKSTLDLLKLVANYRLDWGLDSYEIYNDTYNPGATKLILLKNLSSKDHELHKANFELSNSEVVKTLVESFISDDDLSKEILQSIHYLIIKDGGHFRTTNVMVEHDDVSFVFTNYKHIVKELESLILWYNKNKESAHPVFIAGVFHYRILAIHPFVDGNGRLARIITSMILLRNNIPPPVFLPSERYEYFIALKKADEGKIEDWLEYFGKKIISSFELVVSK
jgi:Fic family protein